MVGLATFRTVTTLVANITTDNVGTLNVSGVAQIAKLTINSALRSSNDLFNVSTSSTSHYLYYNSDSVFGHINTNFLYNWYINSSAICSLQNLCIGSANMRTSTDMDPSSSVLDSLNQAASTRSPSAQSAPHWESWRHMMC